MGFKRSILPERLAKGDELTQDLAGIGILVGNTRSEDPNIENTVFAASVEGMGGDLRTLSLLVDWLDVHVDRLNADRLINIAKASDSNRVRCFWKAVAQWKDSDSRLKRLLKIYRGPRLDVLNAGSDYLIKRHGEDERFAKSGIRVPITTLRRRPKDILAPEELARIHHSYKIRIVIGPTYRADMWATLEKSGLLPASQLARKAFGSFATAWQVLHDWSLVNSKLP
jgi:hypothetical protein